MRDMLNKAASRLTTGSLALTGTALAILAGGVAVAQTYTGWSPPVSAEVGSDPTLNTVFNDGCPILSPDGLSLYMATNRGKTPAGAATDIDIWVARRATTTDGWGAPEALPAPINGPTQDFCPTPVRGRGLFFVSKRHEPNGDIYFTRQRKDGSWEEPVRLGPEVNSSLEEWSPSYFEDEQGRPVLYFSRNTPGTNTHKIFTSVGTGSGLQFGPAQEAKGGVQSAHSNARPNVRRDGREIVWDSNRQGNGNQDVWTATRASTSDDWGPAQHLLNISSQNGNDTRASLSWDGSLLLVGTVRPGITEGQGDIYVSSRDKDPGGGE